MIHEEWSIGMVVWIGSAEAAFGTGGVGSGERLEEFTVDEDLERIEWSG